jgi:hypothetical protein
MDSETQEVQRLINKMCGIGDETYQKHSADSEINETQRLINALFGIDDETFKKLGPSGSKA